MTTPQPDPHHGITPAWIFDAHRLGVRMLRAQWNHRFADEDEILCNEDFRARYLGSKSVAMRLLAELAVTTGRDPDEILDAIRDELIRCEAGRGLS